MNLRVLAFTVTFFLLMLPSVRAQETTSDTEGVAVLTRALNAVGGAQALAAVQDFTATGTITYYWAGEEVKAPATVKVKGGHRFRLDAKLPEGTRTWVLNRGHSFLREPDGKVIKIPYHNVINAGIPIYPFYKIEAALSDTLSVVRYRGLVESGSGPVHRVRVQRVFPSEFDPSGTRTRLCRTDYILDSQTGRVLKILDMAHPIETLNEDVPHEVEFWDYAFMNGILLPKFVREKIDGQVVWDLQLTNVLLNTGLSDIDFQSGP